MSRKRPLEGRVALITGAGRGIGRGHALEFARLGAKVVVNDFGGTNDGRDGSSSPANEVVDTIKAAGGEAVADYGSVADEADANAMVARALETFGRLDTLVNNAGILRDKSLLNMELGDWNAVLGVHLTGTFLTTRAAGRHWRDRSKAGNPTRARIVNTTSGSGLFGNFGQANYSSAKGGIASLTVLSAIELGKYGVNVNCVAPYAKTRLTAMSPTTVAANNLDFDPTAPEGVSPLVAWLGSDAAEDVTGQIFSVMGGMFRVVEGYFAGPAYQADHQLGFEEISEQLPQLLGRSRPRTKARESFPILQRPEHAG